jgi:hypothetical protein
MLQQLNRVKISLISSMMPDSPYVSVKNVGVFSDQARVLAKTACYVSFTLQIASAAIDGICTCFGH